MSDEDSSEKKEPHPCQAWKSIDGYPWFRSGDFGGFVALFSDQMATLLIVIFEMKILLGEDIVFKRIVPGIGISVIVGNLYYAWMARRLAMKTGSKDVAAQPYGINTPGAFAKMFLVIYPLYFGYIAEQGWTTELTDIQRKEAQEWAYSAAVAANFLSGIFEALGAVVGKFVKEKTEATALLTTLSGVALAFLVLQPMVEMYNPKAPIVSMAPLFIVIVTLLGKANLKIPGPLLAVLVGTALSWIFAPSVTGRTGQAIADASQNVGLYLSLDFTHWAKIVSIGPYIGVLLPVAMTNFVGTMNCVESARLAGDDYDVTESMAADGIGTIIGSMFGSCFGTTVYVGHPAYRAMGAGCGYSIINGVVLFLLSITGCLAPIFQIVAPESVKPLIVFVGLMIIKQTFEESHESHWPAIILGMLPDIADWSWNKANGDFHSADDLEALCGEGWSGNVFSQMNFNKGGLKALTHGALLISLCFTSVTIYAINRDFLRAILWTTIFCALGVVGLVHSDTLEARAKTWSEVEYWACYLVVILFFGLMYLLQCKGWVEAPVNPEKLKEEQEALRELRLRYSKTETEDGVEMGETATAKEDA